MPSLPDTQFLVLAVLAEGRAHGYEIHRKVHDRGFKFWTRLERSSVYKALDALQRAGLVSASLEPGAGPARKVFAITAAGRRVLERDARQHLAAPGHPRSEIDLGIYALPNLSDEAAAEALRESIAHLREREAFLEERRAWCLDRNLVLPALAFERPLVCLQAEIAWLERIAKVLSATPSDELARGWSRYEYEEPP